MPLREEEQGQRQLAWRLNPDVRCHTEVQRMSNLHPTSRSSWELGIPFVLGVSAWCPSWLRGVVDEWLTRARVK